jgi:hypothetical protein
MSKYKEVKEYMFQWLDKKHGGSPSIDEWNPEEVIQFAHDYAQSVGVSGQEIREIIEMNDSLVEPKIGDKYHCILPEHYDELAKEIIERIYKSNGKPPSLEAQIILRNMIEIMPWDLSDNVSPYVLEAIQIGIDQGI